MTWVIHDITEQAVIEEIERQTDRGAALVASAFIENRLRIAIEMRLDPKARQSPLFRVNGALSSFSAKIDMGHALHLYPKTVRDLLNEIRDIRNKFAHRQEPLKFDTEIVRNQCIKLLRHLRVYAFHSTSHINLLEQRFGSPETRRWEGQFTLDEGEMTARWVFISAAKQALLHLSRVIDVFAPHQFSLPPLRDISALRPPRVIRHPSPT
jgi:hypothetical protein